MFTPRRWTASIRIPRETQALGMGMNAAHPDKKNSGGRLPMPTPMCSRGSMMYRTFMLILCKLSALSGSILLVNLRASLAHSTDRSALL
jgi:hypothetical protein